MAVPYITLTTADDFGIVSRGPNDVAICAPAAAGAFQRDELCRIVDDAVVYMRSLGKEGVDAVFTKLASPPPLFDNPPMPSGRIPVFYRVVVATREFQRYAQRPITLPELLFILEAVEVPRNRDDDFWTTSTLAKALSGNVLSPEEKAFFDGVKVNAPAKTAPSGSPFAAALTLGVGGAVVAGPPGGIVGFILGLVAGKK